VVDCAHFRGLGSAPLRELAAALRETYGGTLGVEYLMISDKAQREWLQERMEPTRNRPQLSPEDRAGVLDWLIAAETFEQFLHTSYIRPEAPGAHPPQALTRGSGDA
jgi:2-oxoglutarate dehydrogenase E1 component